MDHKYRYVCNLLWCLFTRQMLSHCHIYGLGPSSVLSLRSLSLSLSAGCEAVEHSQMHKVVQHLCNIITDITTFDHRVLKNVFHDLMLTASSVQWKQLRNDLMMICLRVVQICPDAPFLVRTVLQWNPSKADTIGTKIFVRYSKVFLAQGLVVDHAPPTIAASYDEALLWTTKKTILMRDLSTDSF